MAKISQAVPLARLLAILEAQVSQADAAFQIGQQMGWNEMIEGRPIMEGYDRLLNLGLTDIRLDLNLVAIPPGALFRFWLWLRSLGKRAPMIPEPHYRLAYLGEDRISMNAVFHISRNRDGVWTSRVEPAGTDG